MPTTSLTQLQLHLPNGAVTFDFSLEAATALQAALEQLMQTLRQVATPPAGQRPQPQPVMEFRQRDPIDLEVFCNPNMYPTPFAAQILLTIKTPTLRISTEMPLSQLREDVQQYCA
ncbi:MAG: hypothetical protein RLZZ511_2077 [Cyanobacteriota bacterium]|jgi:hypothetical protein